EIEYKKGADNAAADALSRIERKGVLFSMLAGTSNELLDAQNDQLMRKDKWVVGKDVELKKKLIDHFHGSAVGGHFGVQATTKRLITYFYWKGLGKMVKEWVRTYDVCQRNKSDLSAYPWKSSLFVVVDRLSKYAHFLPLAYPYTTSQVARLFLDNVYKLHGLPKTIVGDRDKVFMSLFWQSLFKKLQVKLKMSIAYHPQTDGQTEIVNKCLETYLRCMTGETPKDWVKWVPLVKYWYNTNYHSILDTTPYEVVYGQTPPMHIPYMAKDSPVEAVDRTLQEREQVVQLLKGQHKLSLKFFGPFQVVEKIGKVVYKLRLPDYAKVHPVFHVSQLKPCYIDSAAMGSFPVCDSEGLLAATPLKLLDKRMVKRNNRMVVFGLIQWSNGSEEDATWEKLEDLLARFPE
ncbi:putative mitochondrial protein, partial [Tanacetum coccineum]